MARLTDIETTWTASFCILTPVSDVGTEWMRTNLHHPIRGMWPSIPVDHRMLTDIVLGARADGLIVESTN